MDFDETDLFQLLMTNLSMVGTMSNNSYTTVNYQQRTSLKQKTTWYMPALKSKQFVGLICFHCRGHCYAQRYASIM